MRSLVDKLLSDPTGSSMGAVIDRILNSGATDDDIAYLAITLGRSGSVLSIPGVQRVQQAADLASSGAPTSLSTLLGPLYLRSMGCLVPKLGVPGRPAGGVDTLAQVPGYRVNLNTHEIMNCIDRCGYAHFLANQEHAPLDARLFKYRQKSGAQSIPELTIASILSKKVAVGLQRVGLDVRVARHGNFGRTWEKARRNALRFRRVASIIGIDSVCFLTDARFPYQPFVGRGESLVALEEIFAKSRNQLLGNHSRSCLAMARGVVDKSDVDIGEIVAEAEKHFYENLLAQGSCPDAFHEYVDKIRKGHRFQYVSTAHGFASVHLERMRDLFLRFQSVGTATRDFFQDRMGMIFYRFPGDLVQPGDLLATIRIAEEDWHLVERQLENVIPISASLDFGVGFERVTDE